MTPPFATTRWSVVLAARDRQAADAHEALASLCSIYWYPLYAFIRRWGHDAESAQDLTQEFFVRLLDKDFLSAVDRSKGKFRSFLLAAANHFLLNEAKRERAEKRGGGRTIVPLDADAAEGRYVLEPAHELTAEKLFERRWALTLLERVLARLDEEMAQAGKSAAFAKLKTYLLADADAESYRQAAEELGTSESAARVTVHRLRKRYREILRDEIAQTVDGPEQIEDEIRMLFAALE